MSPDPTCDDANEQPRPCLSLPQAVCAIARDAGYTIDCDTLCAAMGLSLMVPAVPDEPDLRNWPRYARDAFLVTAGRLFGMTIRAMHPPEAARGLSSSEEFRQHFDASYHPLVLRALEHDQPVLAWQGWPGEARLSWGVITDACDDGVGLAGRVCGCDAISATHVLERPPVQVYVVETTERRQPEPGELLEAFLAHSQTALSNALHTRFGVTTGPTAYDRWIDRLRDDEADGPTATAGHRALAAAAIAAHKSADRFVRQVRPGAEGSARHRLDAVSRLLPAIVESLRTSAGTEAAALATPTAIEAVTRARDATAELTSALAAK